MERLECMDWQLFLPLLSEFFSRKNKVIGRGRPHLDYLMMFKVPFTSTLHNLSDDAMEYQLFDRLSFRRFVGCHEDNVPDSKLSGFIEIVLTQSRSRKGIILVLYSTLGRRFDCPTGQMVDASFVECPKQQGAP